jgi:hypothetical protein
VIGESRAHFYGQVVRPPAPLQMSGRFRMNAIYAANGLSFEFGHELSA